MKMETRLIIVAGLGLGAFLIARATASGVVNAVGTAAHAVNPFNNDNIINQGFTDLYQEVTGSDDTLGGDIYDYTHPPAAENTNPINGAAISLYQGATGSEGTIGTDLYDWLHPAPGDELNIGNSIREFFFGDKDKNLFYFGWNSPDPKTIK